MASKAKAPTKRAPQLGTKTNPKPWADIPERDREDALGVIEECAKVAWTHRHQGTARALQSAINELRKATPAAKEGA